MNVRVGAPWIDYRRRNRLAIWWLILGLPLTIPVMFFVGYFLPDYPDAVMFGVLVGWSVVWLVLAFRVARLRCPRCHEIFFAHQAPEMLAMPRSCANCGLQIYDAP